MKHLFLFAAALCCAAAGAANVVFREATAGMGYAATSVNAAVFRGGSLTSISNIQYVAYYDADGCQKGAGYFDNHRSLVCILNMNRER